MYSKESNRVDAIPTNRALRQIHRHRRAIDPSWVPCDVMHLSCCSALSETPHNIGISTNSCMVNRYVRKSKRQPFGPSFVRTFCFGSFDCLRPARGFLTLHTKYYTSYGTCAVVYGTRSRHSIRMEWRSEWVEESGPMAMHRMQGKRNETNHGRSIPFRILTERQSPGAIQFLGVVLVPGCVRVEIRKAPKPGIRNVGSNSFNKTISYEERTSMDAR